MNEVIKNFRSLTEKVYGKVVRKQFKEWLEKQEKDGLEVLPFDKWCEKYLEMYGVE